MTAYLILINYYAMYNKSTKYKMGQDIQIEGIFLQ